MDEIRFGATSDDVLPTIQYLTWDNAGGGGDLTWEAAANWDPDVTPTSAHACTIDNGDTVSLATSGEAISLDIGATAAGTTLNVSGTLAVVPLPLTVGSNGTLNVTGTLAAVELNTSGTVTIGPAADVTGVAMINLNGGTLTAGGALTTYALTYNAGTLDLGGNDLNVSSLTANGSLDVSGSTVSAATAVTVNNATLTLGNAVATGTLTLDCSPI